MRALRVIGFKYGILQMLSTSKQRPYLPLRVIRADYLALIALSVGRAKDFARVLALREAGAVTDKDISDLAMRHNLTSDWNLFKERFDES